MYTRPRFPLSSALQWTWRAIPVMTLWAGALTTVHVVFDQEWLRVPGMLVAVMGTAVSFYLGFKGNAGYGRLWEARIIWGAIVNDSRTWGTHVTTFVAEAEADSGSPEELEGLAEIHRELVYRHVAWLAALRTQLRRLTPWEHNSRWDQEQRRRHGTIDNSDEMLRSRVAPFVSTSEIDELMNTQNRATQLLQRQGERLQELRREGRIDDFRHMELARLVQSFYALQGRCERIKNFPMPRQYASANHWFVNLFIAILPLGLLGGFHVDGMPEAIAWLMLPASVIVGWMFYTWDMVLEYSENPFEGLVNDIPMDALSRTIEIDLREMLGETTLPAPVEPTQDDVLM